MVPMIKKNSTIRNKKKPNMNNKAPVKMPAMIGLKIDFFIVLIFLFVLLYNWRRLMKRITLKYFLFFYVSFFYKFSEMKKNDTS